MKISRVKPNMLPVTKIGISRPSHKGGGNAAWIWARGLTTTRVADLFRTQAGLAGHWQQLQVQVNAGNNHFYKTADLGAGYNDGGRTSEEGKTLMRWIADAIIAAAKDADFNFTIQQLKIHDRHGLAQTEPGRKSGRGSLQTLRPSDQLREGSDRPRATYFYRMPAIPSVPAEAGAFQRLIWVFTGAASGVKKPFLGSTGSGLKPACLAPPQIGTVCTSFKRRTTPVRCYASCKGDGRVHPVWQLFTRAIHGGPIGLRTRKPRSRPHQAADQRGCAPDAKNHATPRWQVWL
jgi:hypothetical protein